jgi:EpsI family protein
LPAAIGDWRLSGENALEPLVAAYLRPDSYLMRDYTNQDGRVSVNLFVAYFKSLQNSYGPHSPRACLPGNGWNARSWKVIPMTVSSRPEAIPVNEYMLEKGREQILVLYWYQNNRRVWAEEFQAKLNLLPDLLRYRRSDVSLVRIVTPLNNSDSNHSLESSKNFAQALFPVLAERLDTGE